MQSRTVAFVFPEQLTVKVEVESVAVPASTLTLPYDPDALVTVQLWACAGDETKTAAQNAAMVRRIALGSTAPLSRGIHRSYRLDRASVALGRNSHRTIGRKAARRCRPRDGGLSEHVAHQALAEGNRLSLVVANIERGDTQAAVAVFARGDLDLGAAHDDAPCHCWIAALGCSEEDGNGVAHQHQQIDSTGALLLRRRKLIDENPIAFFSTDRTFAHAHDSRDIAAVCSQSDGGRACHHLLRRLELFLAVDL